MSFLTTLRDYARSRSAGRRRLAAYLYVAELPTNIRKDIGWPNAYRNNTVNKVVTGGWN